jgi:hypothetical protein
MLILRLHSENLKKKLYFSIESALNLFNLLTMKKFLLISIISLTVFSCDKDNEQNTPQNVKGLWIGTYTVDQLPAQGALYYSLIVKPDGSLLTEGKGGNGTTYYSVGTWTLVGDSLKCSHTSINAPPPQVSQTLKFFFNSSNGTLSSGTWKDGANGSNYTGTFPTMVKIY